MLLAYPIAKLLMFQLCCQNLINAIGSGDNAIASGDNAIVSGDNAIALPPPEFWINLGDRITPTPAFVNILKTHKALFV
jgi:Head domain of trimeric autotransporter adhesin